jgi:hypothetical protein
MAISQLGLLSRVALLMAIIFPGAALAQEFSVFGGATRQSGPGDRSYGWALDYRHGLGEHAAWTLSWLNEGHFEGHHRDGHAAQLWLRTTLLDERLALAAGAGPYRYYDTRRPTSSAPTSNEHSWAALYSVSATYYTDTRWLYELRINRIVAANSLNTTSAWFGVGYQLDRPVARGPLTGAAIQPDKATENEFTLFIGHAISNTHGSPRDVAYAAQYRRGLSRHIDWTVGWLEEGETMGSRRKGVITQLWGVRTAFDEKLAFGAGIGPYLSTHRHIDATGASSDERKLSALVSATAAVRLHKDMSVRVIWSRVATNYDRDSDVVLLGVGYRF